MAPTGTRTNREVFIANQSFLVCTHNGRADGNVIVKTAERDRDGNIIPNADGIDTQIHEGRTRVYEGCDVLKRFPHMFDRLSDVDAPNV